MGISSQLRKLDFWVQRVLLQRRFVTAPARRHGLRLKGRTTDGITKDLFRRGSMDDEEIELLRREVRFEPGDVVLDVGANLGWYSLVLDRDAPQGVDIYAFEPDPLNFELLEHNIELNGARHVHPLRLAVAEREGVAALHRADDTQLGSHTLLARPHLDHVEVETVTLDGFWRAQGLYDRVPRLIKMDIEGSELDAVRGGRSVLSRCPFVLMEHSPGFLLSVGRDPFELLAEMRALGFRPAGFDIGDLEDPDLHLNVLWVRSG